MQQNWIIDCWNPKDRFHTHSIESKTLLCKMHLKIMSAEFLYQKANKLFKMQLYRAYPLLPSRVRLSNSWWRHQMETFSRYWPFMRYAGNSPVTREFPHKGQWRGALMFSSIYARINGWVNNREAGDLKRNRAHFDVTAMIDRCLGYMFCCMLNQVEHGIKTIFAGVVSMCM